MRSVVRGVTAGYDAKALYTAEREALATQMFDQLKPMLESRGVKLERVLRNRGTHTFQTKVYVPLPKSAKLEVLLDTQSSDSFQLVSIS